MVGGFTACTNLQPANAGISHNRRAGCEGPVQRKAEPTTLSNPAGLLKEWSFCPDSLDVILCCYLFKRCNSHEAEWIESMELARQGGGHRRQATVRR
jgi:hypothetical protein